MISVQAIDLGGLARVQAKLNRLKNLSLTDMRPVLEKIEKIMVEDNRKGLLAGIGGKDQAAPTLRYRSGKGRKTNARKAGFGKGRGHNPTPLASSASGKYQFATGPYLAPFRTKSRVITNYHTRHGQDGKTFFIEGAWLDILSKKGKPFLRYHFKKYEIRGLRAWGRQEASIALRAHVEMLFLMQR